MARVVTGLTVGVLAFVAVSVAEAQERCAAAKVRAVRGKTSEKLSCHKDAVSRGTTVRQSCLDRAEKHFEKDFAKAEAGLPPCFTTGDASAIEAKVDGAVDDLIAELRPSQERSSCAGAKIKAASKKIARKLNCLRRAVLRNEPPDPVCLERAEQVFNLRFAEAEGRPNCLTLGDLQVIEDKIDAFLADVEQELAPPVAP